MTRRLFLSAAIVFLSACITGKQVQSDQPITVLEVDNQAVLDMNIYAVRSGERVRLGTAISLRTSQFTIPKDLLFGSTALSFIADPIGANRLPVSDQITVSPGDTVKLTIPPN